MTLRERIEERLKQLPATYMPMPFVSYHHVETAISDIDAMFAETADADAERERLARIGELVEWLLHNPPVPDHLPCELVIESDRSLNSRVYFSDECGEIGPEPGVDTLLDALEALKAKTDRRGNADLYVMTTNTRRPSWRRRSGSETASSRVTAGNA